MVETIHVILDEIDFEKMDNVDLEIDKRKSTEGGFIPEAVKRPSEVIKKYN